jgi:hypothetical protein
MAIIATSQPFLSEVLMSDSQSLVHDHNYATVNLKEAANTTVTLGSLVYWDNAASAFRTLKNTDFTNDTTLTAPAGVSSLPNGASIGVVVGFNGSLGGEYSQVVGTTNVRAAVLFRGLAAVKRTGLVFDAGVVTARRNTVVRLLEQADIDVKEVAAKVTNSLYGYAG